MNVSAQRPTRPTRLLAIVLESLKLLGIAVGCLIILALVLFISVKTGIVIPRRWAALGCWTSFLIWMILRQYKSYLKQVKFWCVLLCLLLIHVIAFIVVLQWYPDWRLIWYVPTVVIEAQFMGAVLDTVMRNKHSNSR
jgi:hypothetical protein